ncbi:MAG: phosphoribosylglycinamide formyltransferase [Gemmatimonadaceae bacterium]|jgi:formyltetrahydrofolate-dependent phosphoribosylglycinamide formyltransferase|nr:phosphoribosylglycinamide formyltransferase [Gemmatimonadaceae bacterium]
MSAPLRLGVLASGGGSNCEALCAEIDARGAASPAYVSLVVSNVATAGVLARAAQRGIAHTVLEDATDGERLLRVLEEYRIDLVVLAGYLKLVPAVVTARFAGRIVNVHPALLPSFGGHGMYGRRVHAAVLAAGCTVTGVTVHLVDEQYDRGPILAQWPVPVHAHDTPESLAARVLRTEHQLFPRAVLALAERLTRGGTARDALLLPTDADAFAWSASADVIARTHS